MKSALELAQLPSSSDARHHSAARPAWWIVAAAIILILAAIAAGVYWRQPSPEASPLHASLLAPPNSDFDNPAFGLAISPDGRLLVFSAQMKNAPNPTLWLRPLGSLNRNGTSRD